jgi:hypothetical protein
MMLPLPLSPDESGSELSELADSAVHVDRAAMLLGHDVVADRQTEASPFTKWTTLRSRANLQSLSRSAS